MAAEPTGLIADSGIELLTMGSCTILTIVL